MIAAEATRRPAQWPAQVDIFGVQCTPTSYAEATEAIVRAGDENQPGVVSCHAVHALITASGDPELRRMVNTFDMVTPDGQPVRWALNLLHGTHLRQRVYGPELMLQVCAAAAEREVPIYLYGGSEAVVEQLTEKLTRQIPGLDIAGYESPPEYR